MTRRWLAIGLWLAGIALCLWVVMHGKVTTDMSAFLPRLPTAEQRILVEQLRSGATSHLIMVGIGGAPPGVLAATSKALATALRGDAAFASIANGDMAGLGRDARLLLGHRYLLSPAVSSTQFTVAGLRDALTGDLGDLASDAGMEADRTLEADPTGAMGKLEQALMPGTHPAMRDGIWVSPDGSRALLLAETKAAGFDVDAQQAAEDRIRDAFARANGVGSAKLEMAGPGVFAVHGRDTMKRDTSRFSTVASLLVAGLLLAAYRSPAMLVLAMLPVASGVLAGMAAVVAGFGFIHGITLGFGVTLIGEAVDYAIYYFTYARGGADLSRLWPVLILGMAVSVVGFAAMVFSSFTGFAQLGVFTIVGLMVALAVTRFVLPALPLGRRQAVLPVAGLPLGILARHSARLRPVVLASTVAALAFLTVHRASLWDSDIASLSPASAADSASERSLRADMGAPTLRYLALARGADLDRALQASEAMLPTLDHLKATGAIGGYDSPSTLLPSLDRQRKRQADLLPAGLLKANLDEATRGLPFKPGTFAPFLAEVERERTAPPVTLVDFQDTDLSLRLNAALDRMPDGWMAITALHDADPAKLARTTPPFEIVDLKAMSNGLLTNYRSEALLLAATGSLAIVALLGAVLRSASRVVSVCLPLAAAVALTAALALGFQRHLSIFTLFGLLLTVAVGSNYCLFLERQRQDEGEARPFAALALANLCTVIGFGVLGFSGIPVLRGIGGTVALGAFLSLVFGTILIAPRKAAP